MKDENEVWAIKYKKAEETRSKTEIACLESKREIEAKDKEIAAKSVEINDFKK